MMKTANRIFSLGLAIIFVASLMGIPTRSARADGGGGSGSVSLTALGSAYTQNFDTLAQTGIANVLAITGWYLNEVGTSARSDGKYGADNGTSSTGDTYSYGPTSNSDRALGSLLSGTITSTIGASFTNNTGSTIGNLLIAYYGEEWRLGTASRLDYLNFQFSTDATSLTTGTWNDFSALSFSTPDQVTVGVKNGNAASERTAISATIGGLAISNGATFWIRWNDVNAAGSDDGLAVDDFSLTPQAPSPTNPTGTGSASPSLLLAGDTTLLTMVVTPGAYPATTGHSVTCDLSSIGGSISQVFVDNGSNNFSYSATVDTGTTPGAKNLACTIGDNESRPGTATIGLTVLAVLPIGTVNGEISNTTDAPSHLSPYVPTGGSTQPWYGQYVTVQGVIYEKTLQATSSGGSYNGFFIQNTTATADGNANTSDGLFAFMSTNSTIPGPSGTYTPAVGDEVVLYGQTEEYYNMTELGNLTLIKVIRSGVVLDSDVPAVVANPPVNLADANRYWERLQGMRVQVPANSKVLGGRNVFSPADAEIWLVRSDYTDITGRSNQYARRAFRDAHPLDDNYDAVNWDGNGYRMVMGSLGLKANGNDASILLDPVRTFATMTNSPAGGLNYTFSKYRVEVTTQPIFTNGVDPSSNNPPAEISNRSLAYSIVDYNLENLYDYRNNPASGCDFTGDAKCLHSGTPFLADVTPPFDYVPVSDAAYQSRLNDIALQIINDLHSPDILMVQEVENQDICTYTGGVFTCPTPYTDGADGKPDVLQELAAKIASNGGPAYDAAFDRDSSDLRGIAPAFLYRTDRVQLPTASSSDPVLGSSPAIVYAGAAVANNSQVSNPKTLNAVLPTSFPTADKCETSWVFPRAPDIGLFRIYRTSVGVGDYRDVYVINNHFKSGPDSCVTHRTEQAKYNAAIVKAIETANSSARIVVGGDLNVYPRPDDPFAPIGQTGSSDQLGLLYDPSLGLTNLWENLLGVAPESAYSYVYLGQAQTLDQMFINGPLMADLKQFRIAHINSDFPADYTGDVARGTSDHDPNVASFNLRPTTVWVCVSGDCGHPGFSFNSIQEAINAVDINGTVNVLAGTYNEVVTVNKSITLNGAQAGIDARGRVGSESILLAQAGGSSAISITANNVTIDGFAIQGAGTAGLAAWGINAAAGSPTSGVHITNTIFQNLYEGLHVQGPDTNVSSHMTVDKNSFFDDLSDAYKKDAGIWMASAPSDHLTITNNSFSGHDGCDGGDYAAINIDFSTNLVISNNTGHNDGSFLVLVNNTNVTVSGNSMTNSSTPSCYMESSAIFLGLGNNGVTIQNNSLDRGYRGVRLSTAFGTGLNQNIKILNNAITNMVNAGILVPVGTVSDPVIVHGNQLTGNPVGIQNDNTTPIVDATNNWWGSASGPGPVGPGTGDHVSLNVNFTPWCVNEACTSAQPPLPSSFWGYIHFQTGDNPPTSTSVLTAEIPGMSAPAASVILAEPDHYAFNVPGDVDGTTVKEGGVENDVITFKIDGRIVATGVWHRGTNVELDFHPPQAVPGGPYYGLVGASISLNGSANDWGPAPTNYAWDLDNNGSYETSGQNITHSWPTVGDYTIGLQVTDSQGGVGTATTTVHIASITLGSLSQTYSGTAKAATATTNQTGLTVNFAYTPTDPPINAGSYGVTATITGYTGSVTGTLFIHPASLDITASSTSKIYGTALTFAGTEFTTVPSPLYNSDSVTSVTLVSTGAGAAAIVGDYDIVASAAVGTGLNNYTIVYHKGTLHVTPATATIVSVGNLNPVAPAGPFGVTITTSPTGVATTSTYSGNGYGPSTTPPTAPGTYSVVVTITDPNYTGSPVTVTMHIQTTCTVTGLVAGWNLVSLCLAPVNTAPGTVLNSLSGSYDLVYGWDGSVASNNWLKFSPSGPPYANNMTILDEKMGFWVHMTAPGSLTVTGYPPVTTIIPLSTAGGGWNLVGYPSQTAMTLPGTLHDFSLIYAYHAADTADPWKLYDVVAPAFVNDLTSLTATWGYWINVGAIYTWDVNY